MSVFWKLLVEDWSHSCVGLGFPQVKAPGCGTWSLLEFRGLSWLDSLQKTEICYYSCGGVHLLHLDTYLSRS